MEVANCFNSGSRLTGIVEENEACFPCETCGKKFYKKKKYTDHLNVHAGLRPYQCPLCPLNYSTDETYRSHLKHSHNKITPLQAIKIAKEMNDDNSEHAGTGSEASEFVAEKSCGESVLEAFH